MSENRKRERASSSGEDEEDEVNVGPTPPPSPLPPTKKPRLMDPSLEQQLFDWEGWDQLCEYGDMCFYGVKLKDDTTGLKDQDIDCVEWMPSASRAVFVLKSGLNAVYPLKITIQKSK